MSRFAVVLCVLLNPLIVCAASAAQDKIQPVFPKEIIGVWMLGVESCTIPKDPAEYIEAKIVIEASNMQLAESNAIPKSVKQLSTEPLSWKIETEEDNYGELHRSTMIYVLGTSKMAVTNGDGTEIYARCR